MSAAAIEADGLVKRFRELRGYRDLLTRHRRPAHVLAVDGISLSIGEGELFGVLGPNGAGKTTLIRLLTSALRPTAGRARVAGFDVERETAQVRAEIGLIGGEDRSFFRRISGRENLEFFAALQHVPRRSARLRIGDLLERLGLAPYADRRVEAYSAGMRQKLSIARGLVGDASVVFMDEPTRALDPISARDVRGLVRDYVVGELGRTVLLATHSMPEAEQLCDRVALVQQGRVLDCGTVDELRRAVFPRVHCELRLQELPAGLVEALRRRTGVLSVDVGLEDGLPRLLLELADEGAVAGVLREAVEAGAEIHGCSTRPATLEEIYVRRLGAPAPETVVT